VYGCVAGKHLSTDGNDLDTIALFPHPTCHDRRRRAQDRRDAATGEECGDGNSQDGDGCSAGRMRGGMHGGGGYTCSEAEPTVRTTDCGDGSLAGAEVCDDAHASEGA
jgi:hypothetical protein